jgi:type II secretion system protein G
VAPHKGFTLIELLIVIAIILILISIALPNFLEAQVRAKVARAKGDLHSLAVALESYRIDWRILPKEKPVTGGQDYVWNHQKRLTTPHAYLKSLPMDSFRYAVTENFGFGNMYLYVLHCYDLYEAGWRGTGNPYDLEYLRQVFVMSIPGWSLYSTGPDYAHYSPPKPFVTSATLEFLLYSPTNGTVSEGNIVRNNRSADGYIRSKY